LFYIFYHYICNSKNHSFSQRKYFILIKKIMNARRLKCFIKQLTPALCLWAGSWSANAQVTVSGATAGNGSYATLAAAFGAINAGTQGASDNIVVQLSAGTSESTTASLAAGNWSSLTIFPTSAAVSVTGNIAGALISLNGADRVTIDGRLNQSGTPALTLTNTATGSSQVVKLSNDASLNRIQYCTLKGANSVADNGIITVGAGSSTGNDNNTIQYCDICNDGSANYPTTGICLPGSSGATNDGNSILYCNLYNFNATTATSVSAIEVSANSHSTTIGNNRIFWSSSTSAGANAILYNGIVATGKSTTISGNIIGFASKDSTGTATFTGTGATGFTGITATGESGFPTSITGNIISNISITSTGALGASSDFGICAGIYIKNGEALVGTSANTGNRIKNISLITSTNYTSPHALNGIAGYSSAPVSIRYNEILGLSHEPAGNYTSTVRGIQMGSSDAATRTGSITISENRLHDFTAGKTNNSGILKVQGIHCNNLGGNVQSVIEKNTIYNLNVTQSGSSAQVYGISFGSADPNSGSLLVRNNMVRLGLNVTTSAGITGIEAYAAPASGSHTCYVLHNSVYIGGSNTGQTASTYALSKSYTGSLAHQFVAKNNILVNLRTGGSTGKHYAIGMAAATDYSSQLSDCDYNLYQIGTATENQFGQIINSSQTIATLASWKTTCTGFDANSREGDPLFAGATTTPPDLHITATSPVLSAGTDLTALVPDDFDGALRKTGSADMGADGQTPGALKRSGAWSVSANWDNGSLPAASDNVSIPAGKSVSIDAYSAVCNNLYNYGSVAINSDATSTGQLKINGSASGNITFNRYMVARQWHAIYAPLAGETIEHFLAVNDGISSSASSPFVRAMTDFNPAANSWNNYFDATTTGSMGGKGFMARRKAAGTVAFTGTAQTGNLTLSGLIPGKWNCIGNPYTTAISVSDFLAANAGNFYDSNFSTIYVYKSNNAFEALGSSTTDNIQPGQAFLIRLKAGASSISFTTAMQRTEPTASFRSAAPWDWSEVNLVATNATTTATARIALNDAMTKGADATFDGGLYRNADTSFALFTRHPDGDSTDLGLQCLPNNLSNTAIPVGIDYKAGGGVSFSATSSCPGSSLKLILEDRLKGTETNLSLLNASYTATIPANATGAGRFFLRIEPANAATATTQPTRVVRPPYFDGNMLVIPDQQLSGVATLCDISGKKLISTRLSGGHETRLLTSPASGLFILVISNGNNSKSFKVSK